MGDGRGEWAGREDVPLDCAIKTREETAPYAEVAAENRCARFHGCDGAYSPFAVGTVVPKLLVSLFFLASFSSRLESD